MIERPIFTSNPFNKETSFGAVSAVLTPVGQFSEEVRRAMCLPDEGVVIEIHMPKAVKGNGNNNDNKYAGVLGAFSESFGQIASEAVRWGSEFHSVVAVTHGIASRTSRRFGFAVKKVSKRHVDSVRLKRARKGYKLTARYQKGEKKMGPIFACYQSFEKYMQKFGGRANFVPEEVPS